MSRRPANGSRPISRGFGPRYLHSCGQLRKGGPDGGVFLFITADHDDLPIPRVPLGFGAVQEARAVADMEELTARGGPRYAASTGGHFHNLLKVGYDKYIAIFVWTSQDMHALIVVAHPDPASLTHAIATQVAQGITGSEPRHSFEIADLAAEAFDPRFTQADVALHLRNAAPSPDVAAEHARIDRADALVLVYPVHWWSFPGLLKGWIDRVFTNGWAYDAGPDGKLLKKLQRLQVHLIASGGADMRTYARHGYFGAMKTQIDHGIFGYCGARVATSELLVASDAGFPASHLDAAHAIGKRIFPLPQ